MAMKTAPALTPERQAFYDGLAPDNMAPLWERFSSLIAPEPRSIVRPCAWSYAAARPKIMRAGELITAKEAERRVLILENPGFKGQSRITNTLYAGWQLILPGEVAPNHRHSQSALRFVVEGEGAYTAVDGERTLMREGDFVITPAWTWHDHGNDSQKPMVWLDGLDIPIVGFFEASFAEGHADDRQALTRPEGDSLARYGSGLMPEGYKGGKHGRTSPVLNYPYARTREALARMSQAGPPDSCHGHRLNYVNPETGAWAMPTIGPSMRLLPKGFATELYRSTDAQVFSAVEGHGTVTIGDTVLSWQKRDVFVVPGWIKFSIFADAESVLFSFSDRPVQEALGLWREDRGNH
ncbi:MAG: gentisate 1,2-dioxygenase [Alphaproteobacteria bacterium]|nr:gentisate 1,2-dioxygenase [Alphaproteobacteria bacterium]